MPGRVGSKGQIVIKKEIRDQLGVQPGWQAVQMLVDNHVEVFFMPPEHKCSLRGAAKPFIRRTPFPNDDWDELAAEDAADDFIRNSKKDQESS